MYVRRGSKIGEGITFFFFGIALRPGSVDSLNGGSTDAMKKAPVEK